MLGEGRRCEFSQELLVTTLFDLKNICQDNAGIWSLGGTQVNETEKLKEQYGNLAKQVSKQGNKERGNLRARKPFA